jgi:hypothetical protein
MNEDSARAPGNAGTGKVADLGVADVPCPASDFAFVLVIIVRRSLPFPFPFPRATGTSSVSDDSLSSSSDSVVSTYPEPDPRKVDIVATERRGAGDPVERLAPAKSGLRLPLGLRENRSGADLDGVEELDCGTGELLRDSRSLILGTGNSAVLRRDWTSRKAATLIRGLTSLALLPPRGRGLGTGNGGSDGGIGGEGARI